MYIKSINNVVGYKDLPDGFNVEFNENKTYIVGANFQRKTTVGSLFNWCLTGTSLNGKEKEQVANDIRRVSNVIVDITFVDNLGIEHRLIRDKGKEIHITLEAISWNQRETTMPEDLCFLYGQFFEDYMHDVEVLNAWRKDPAHWTGE